MNHSNGNVLQAFQSRIWETDSSTVPPAACIVAIITQRVHAREAWNTGESSNSSTEGTNLLDTNTTTICSRRWITTSEDTGLIKGALQSSDITARPLFSFDGHTGISDNIKRILNAEKICRTLGAITAFD
jgi:hypothetical protein